MKIELLAIDQQNDFHDIPDEVAKDMGFSPALPVTGAWEDAKRVADFIKRCGSEINGITMTMDTHQQYDIGHALFWKDSNGNSPAPYTAISADDIRNKVWSPRDTRISSEVLKYAETIESNNQYQVFIWPDHCIVGTTGYSVVKPVMDELLEWERKYIGRVNFVTKGHNPFTEHYGGFKAEVPLPNDPTTQLNIPLIKKFQDSDLVILTGQALSHCVATTVTQLADNFGDENIKKLVLMRDTTSSVTGFEQNGEDFVNQMTARGMRVVNSTDIVVTRDGLKIGGQS